MVCCRLAPSDSTYCRLTPLTEVAPSSPVDTVDSPPCRPEKFNLISGSVRRVFLDKSREHYVGVDRLSGQMRSVVFTAAFQSDSTSEALRFIERVDERELHDARPAFHSGECATSKELPATRLTL